jgi:hypothetical protein
MAIVAVRTRDLFSYVDIFGSQSNSNPLSAAKRWTRRIWTTKIAVLAGIALVCPASYFMMRPSGKTRVKLAAPQVQASAAELISANGMVLVRKPGRREWQEVRAGARLTEGDLIQTDSSGSASIRYSDGTNVSIQEKTIFTIQNGGHGDMEITAPAIPENGIADAESGKELTGAILGEARASELKPSMELQSIIPFGRSLELIGHVEAGSSLVVNGETVIVAGDGSFRHFTNPFPAAAGKVRLVMKVTDLAGRTRALTTTHDFSPHGRDN